MAALRLSTRRTSPPNGSPQGSQTRFGSETPLLTDLIALRKSKPSALRVIWTAVMIGLITSQRWVQGTNSAIEHRCSTTVPERFGESVCPGLARTGSR